jgi:fructose-1-phosphate kinase PfkB-like protein
LSGEASARDAAGALGERGVGTVVLKAGDAFNAGLAFALNRGDSLTEASRFACAVGALSTTAVGARSAMPGLTAVRDLLLR